MNLVVQKYGGSSVADTDKILNVAKRVSKKIRSGMKVVVVVSAMGKTTDNLIKEAKKINKKPNDRELDMLLTTGEQVSAALLSMALQKHKIKSKSLNAYQAGINTIGRFTEAKIQNFDNKKILSLLNEYNALVVTGFQGINKQGELTTLGRGGSDTSAVALAASLNAECEIYSDVDGIYTVDPKLYPKAKKLNYITYDEMLELSAHGAKVLHFRAVEIAKKFNLPVYCASSFNGKKGSYVVSEDKIIEKSVVTGLTALKNQTRVFIKNLPKDYSVVRKIFSKVALAGLNVDMISLIESEQNITLSFSVVDEKKTRLEKMLKSLLKNLAGWEVIYETGLVKISIVGIGMKSETGVAAKYFDALKDIPIKLVTTSEIKISCLIDEKYQETAVNSLAKKFKL